MAGVKLRHEKSGRTVVVDEGGASFYTERGWADTQAAAAEVERAAKAAQEAAEAAEKAAREAKDAEKAAEEKEGGSGSDSGEGDATPVKATKRGANTAR